MRFTGRMFAALVAAMGLARAGDSPNVVTGISFEDKGAAIVMTVTGARPPVFTSFEMQEPPRFVLDLEAEGAATLPQDVERSDGAIRRVQTFRYGVTPSSIVRVLVTLVPGAAPSWDVVNVSSEGKAVRVRIAKAKGSPPVRAQTAPPPPPPPPRDRVEEDGAVVVANGGRWRLALGPELPLRGPGPCRTAPQPAPAPGSCARPVMLVDLGAFQPGSRVYAGTVPGCGEWRAVSVTTERDWRARITLAPWPGAAERSRAVVEVYLGPPGWALDAIPAAAACAADGRCTWVHVIGFSPTGAFAHAVGQGKANAPGAPSELEVTHLVTDRTLIDLPYAREAGGVLIQRYGIAQAEPWAAAGPTAPFDVVFERGEVKLRRADGASKRLGKLPKGSAAPRVLGCFQSPAERRMAVVVATGAPGGIAVFGAHQEAGFPGYAPAKVPLAEAPPEAIAALVRAGVDPNGRDAAGSTALVNAVGAATDFVVGTDLEVALVRLRALLAAGADPNRPDAKGRTALGEAVGAANRTLYWFEEGNEEEIDASRAGNNQIPRAEAKRQRHAVVEALLARGADPSVPTETGVSPAARAYCDGDAEVKELFSKARRGAPVTARALLAQSPAVKDWSARMVLDECALAHLAQEGGTPEEVYAAATRPTQVGTVPLGRVLDLAADHPTIAAKARTDPALAEGRNDARVRVALGLDRLDDPATLRRVLAAAGSLEPAGVGLCGVSAWMIPSWTFTEDGHVEVTEACPDDAPDEAREEPEAGSAGRCTTRGTYTVSGRSVVVTLPDRPPQRSDVQVRGLTVSVAGATNAARECPADP